MAILGEKVFITLGAAAPPPAQEVAPALIGCLLLKRQAGGALLGGVIVETEAYGQSNRGKYSIFAAFRSPMGALRLLRF